MSSRTTLILLALCVLGTWYVGWVDRHQGFWFYQDQGQAFNFPSTSLNRIEIQRTGETLTCERQGDGWWMSQPLEWAAAPATMDRLVNSIRTLRIRSAIDGDPSDYGIGPDQLRVRFAIGNDEHELHFGNDHPDQPFAYATLTRAGQEPELIAVDAPVRDVFRNVTVLELRDVTICDINSFRAGRVTIRDASRGSDQAVVLEREDQGWVLTQPFRSVADIAEVRQLVDVLNSWSISEFVEDGVDPQAPGKPYGLEAPRWTVSIEQREGDRSRTLLLGAAGPPDSVTGQPQIYVARAGDRSVCLASAQVLELLDRDPDVYRHRLLFSNLPPELSRVEIELPGAGGESGRLVVAELQDGNWTVRAGDDGPYPVDASWFQGFTEQLRQGAIGTHQPVTVSDRQNLQQFGLDRPIRIVLTPLQGEAEEILVGKRVPDRGDERYIFNRSWKEYYVTALLPVEDLLLDAPWTLRSTRLFGVNGALIDEFELSDGEGRHTTILRPRTSWYRKGKGQTPLAPEVVERVVGILASLEVTKWQPPSEGAPTEADHVLQLTVSRVRGDAAFQPMTFYLSGPLRGYERVGREAKSDWCFRIRAQEANRDLIEFLHEFLRQMHES